VKVVCTALLALTVLVILTGFATLTAAAADDAFLDARALALADGKPLLIFVRQPALSVAGCVSCRLEHYPGQDYPGVVILIPDGSGGLVEMGRRDCYPGTDWLERRVAELRAEYARVYLRLSFGLGLGISIGRPPADHCHPPHCHPPHCHPHGPHRGK
jgi:hypothetical protein